jgi:hypothetical protein
MKTDIPIVMVTTAQYPRFYIAAAEADGYRSGEAGDGVCPLRVALIAQQRDPTQA